MAKGRKKGRQKEEKLKLGFLVSRLLGGTLDHYGNELDSPRQTLTEKSFLRFFNRITIEPSKIEKLKYFAARGRLIYALPYRSPLDFLFLHYRLRDSDLPTPEIVYNTNVYRFQPGGKCLRIALARLIYLLNFRSWPDPFTNKYYLRRYREGAGFVLHLEDPVSFIGRLVNPVRDPLYHLIKLHRKHGETIIIIPLFLVFDKGPAREGGNIWDIFLGPKDRPGRLRKISHYLRYSGQAFLEVADPITIPMFLARPDQQGLTDEQTAFNLRKELWEHTVREQKVIHGPALKPRTQLMESVLRDPEIVKVMRQESKAQGKKFAVLRRAAARYIDEIAADYSQSTIEFLDLVLSWVWRRIYEGVVVDEPGLARVREAAKRYPVVYVPSHKSHIDYLILSWVLYQHNMVPPHIVAGVNLNTWPIGTIFRKAGAFFMRRSFRDNPLYGAIFEKYIEVLVREGYNIEFFIEGGRSRTGRLLPPKLGIVKYLLSAYEHGVARDIIFVPTYIGHDQILEEKEYLEEMSGTKNPKSNLLEIFRNRSLIQRQYGRIYINFGEPISLRAHLESMSDVVPADAEDRSSILIADLADKIVQGINRKQVVTPFAIMAAALLTSPAKAINRSELLNALALFYQFLVHAEAIFAETLTNVSRAMEDVIDFYQQRKLILVEAAEEGEVDELAEPIYTLPEQNRLSLEMYKNMILHYFLPISFVSMSLLSADYGERSHDMLFEDYRFLKDLFRLEFVHDTQLSDAEKIEASLHFLLSGRHVLAAGENSRRRYTVTPKGRQEMVYFAAMITNFLEAYGLVFNGLTSLQKKPATEKDFLSRIAKTGERLYKQGSVLRPEALSQLLFKNALKYAVDTGMVIVDKSDGKTALFTLNPASDDRRKQMLSIISRFIRVEKYHYLEK